MGPYWEETLPKSRASNGVPGHLFSVGREVSQDKSTYKLMGSGEWVGWLVKGLEREMLEDVVQNHLVKRYV